MFDDKQPELFYVGYDAFLAGVEELGSKLEAGGWRPDFLVGVGRGGLVPAAYLSHRNDIPMLSVDLSSGEPSFADELLGNLAVKSSSGCGILIIDDINDSGTTIQHLRSSISKHGGHEHQVRVAVLINNIRSAATAEYSATAIDRATDKRWFVFPWEAVAKSSVLLEDALSMPERLG